MNDTRNRRQATLIYDGECDFCTQAAQWALDHAWPGALEAVPCESGERERRFPQVSTEDCLQAVQLVLPDGRVLAGSDAAPEILKRFRGPQWRAASQVMRAPGVRHLARPAYHYIAEHRGKLSALFAAPDGHDSPCDHNACSVRGEETS
jgi:predicted DCC family thiol-disulfide oxidoreductase YuxK